MKIKVLLFGIIKDLINNSSLEFDLSEFTTIANFKVILFNNYPELKSYQNFAIAVNEVYEDNSYLLQNNDIVALIPPVSGG